MKNKTMLKWLTGLILAMMIFVGIGPALAHAVEGPLTDVIITKVDTPDEPKDMDLGQLAGGIDVETYFTNGRVLPGVSFTWYEVTEEQYTTLSANPASYSTPDQMTAANYTGTATAETDANGQVTIPDLEEGYYWIVENAGGTIQSSKAVPFGLILPFTNLDGDGWLETINVYPKNTLQGVPTTIEKTVVDGQELVEEKDFNYGDTVTWNIKVPIPLGIEDYDKFIVRDPEVEGLEYVVDSVTSSLGDPEITYDEGLTLDFYDDLSDLAGNDFLTITFDVIFTSAIDPDVLVTNTAYLDFDNGHGDTDTIEDDATVITGGEQFKKLNENGNGLNGAVFVIRNSDGEYLNITDGVVTFGGETVPTEFTSGDLDDNGMFEVKGLADGDYFLEEIKAPEEYALPINPDTPFTVVAAEVEGSYTIGTVEITNRKITIPQTGGMGTMAFTVLGGALMASAVGYYKKTKKA
ncbi:SpaH/EbpB family LPXTG-anchored major pilin [Alkalibacterium putridalgicola]|uniref:SpaH/EbpB family LPXTG-anchored major pilin n=1 Tax=Alkalibacterium putridalgicola TaxID=426703 RepID=UPI0034CFF79B